MNKRCAIYARVSTTDQSDKGYSLPAQIEACQKYAAQLGYSVVAEFSEDVSAAMPVSERNQGKLLFEKVKRGEIDAIIVHKVDRLSRDIVDLPLTVRTWLRAGVEVYLMDIGRVESESNVMFVIKGWQASDDREKIRTRSMDGKRAKAKAGKVVGHRPPYGYKHVRDINNRVASLEPNEQAGIVRLIYDWYVKGDETSRNLSAAAIARKLSEMRLQTPGELNKGYHRKRESGMWSPCMVLSIIQHEVYAGVWRFAVQIGSTRNRRPLDEQISVNVPAIIDRETWQIAQVKRIKNKQFSRRNRKHDYLLGGLIRCGCGFAMSGEFFSDHCYYTCTWRNNHNTKQEKRTCKERSVRADAIEADVWDSIVGIFTDARRFEELLKIAQAEEIESLDPKAEELAMIKSMISDTELEAVEVGEALKAASGIVGRTLEQNMRDVNSRYDALAKRKGEIESDLSNMRLSESAIQNAMEFADDVRLGIEFADYATKRAILETLDTKVIVRDGRFYINSLIGEWDGDIRKLAKVGAKVSIVNDKHLPTQILL